MEGCVVGLRDGEMEERICAAPSLMELDESWLEDGNHGDQVGCYLKADISEDARGAPTINRDDNHRMMMNRDENSNMIMNRDDSDMMIKKDLGDEMMINDDGELPANRMMMMVTKDDEVIIDRDSTRTMMMMMMTASERRAYNKHHHMITCTPGDETDRSLDRSLHLTCSGSAQRGRRHGDTSLRSSSSGSRRKALYHIKPSCVCSEGKVGKNRSQRLSNARTVGYNSSPTSGHKMLRTRKHDILSHLAPYSNVIDRSLPASSILASPPILTARKQRQSTPAILSASLSLADRRKIKFGFTVEESTDADFFGWSRRSGTIRVEAKENLSPLALSPCMETSATELILKPIISESLEPVVATMEDTFCTRPARRRLELFGSVMAQSGMDTDDSLLDDAPVSQRYSSRKNLFSTTVESLSNTSSSSRRPARRMLDMNSCGAQKHSTLGRDLTDRDSNSGRNSAQPKSSVRKLSFTSREHFPSSLSAEQNSSHADFVIPHVKDLSPGIDVVATSSLEELLPIHPVIDPMTGLQMLPECSSHLEEREAKGNNFGPEGKRASKGRRLFETSDVSHKNEKLRKAISADFPQKVGGASEGGSAHAGHSLVKCHSEAESLTKAQRLDELVCNVGEDLTGDFKQPCCLPLIRGKHPDLRTISHDTMAQVLSSGFSDVLRSVTVVDCRYPYEYDGGHIVGARNVYSKAGLIEEFMSERALQGLSQDGVRDGERNENGEMDGRRDIIIFHCEFSSERGPKLMRFLRNKDRDANSSCYPDLYYPEVYLLEGGYKDFHLAHGTLCRPLHAYRPMTHREFSEEYLRYRTESRLFHHPEKHSK